MLITHTEAFFLSNITLEEAENFSFLNLDKTFFHYVLCNRAAAQHHYGKQGFYNGNGDVTLNTAPSCTKTMSCF